MATLTWRNVDASGIGSAAGAQEAASRMFSSALANLQNGLGNWQNQRRANNDSALIADSLRFQDADSLRAALMDGSLLGGRNPTQFSPDALAAVDARQRDLLASAASREQLSNNQYTNQRTRDQNAILDNSRGGAAALLQAATTGGDVQGAFAANRDTLSQLQPDQLSTLMANAQGLRTGDLRNQGSQFDLGVARRNDADNQAAMALGADIQRNTLDPLGLTANVSAAMEGASPGVQGALSRAFPSAFTAQAPASGSAYQPSAFANSIPYGETNDYVKTILGSTGNVTGTAREKAQQLMPALIEKESRGDVNAVGPVGSTGERAQGSTQVIPSTARDPGYGVKPMRDNSPEEQRRFGEDYLTAMINKYDGDVEKGLAAYNSGPGTVDEWLRDRPSAGFNEAVQAQLGQATMTNNASNPGLQDLAASFGSNATIGQIADQIIASDIPGGDRADIIRQLQQIKSQGNGQINDAFAGAILKRSIGAADTVPVPWNMSRFWGTTELGNGVGVVDRQVRSGIDAVLSGATEQAMLAGNEISRLSAGIEQARESSQQATQQYLQARQQANARGMTPELQRQLERLSQQAQMAQAAYQSLLQRRESIPGTDR